MIPDPPVRDDNLCAQCRGPRTLPRTHHRSIDPSVYELDPFCATACCRVWHDNPMPWTFCGDPRERRGRRAAA